MIGRAAELWGTEAYAPSHADDQRFRRWSARLQRAIASPRMVHTHLRAMLEVDLRPLLPLIQVPTLVLHHRDFPLVPAAHGRYLAEHIPGARLVELQGDLPLWWDQQDQVLGVVEEFLVGARRSLEPTRVLATVLFTDIVGSTEGAGELGDQGWRELLDTHDELAGRLVERWGGRLVKTTGDGILATFDGPGRAIGCAVTLRDELHGIGTQIRARLHAGELELRGDNIGGIAVNIAARIMATAGAGEIIVSRTVRDLVAGSGVVLQDRGSQRLRSVEDEWELSRWSAGRFGSPPRRQHVGASAATTMGRSATWSCRRGTRCGSPIAEPPTITMRPAEAAAGRAAPGGAARLDLAGRDDPNLAGAGAAAPAGLGGRSTGPPHVWVHDLS